MTKRKLEDCQSGEVEQQHGRGKSRSDFRNEGSIRADYFSSQHGSKGNEVSSYAERKSKLIEALDKVLENGLEDIDEETFSECAKLRKSLDRIRKGPSSTEDSDRNYSVQQLKPSQLVAGNLSNLKPWTKTSIPSIGSPPPLPAIKDPALEKAAFTHHGTSSFSYERLEWLGDAYIYLISTHLIYHTFPSHTPGRMAQLRERLVKNETLANYARSYDLPRRAILPPEFSISTKESVITKVYGDIFEAYVGAVILADPAKGFENIAVWMKTLWAGTIAADITAEERRSTKYASTALISIPTSSPANPIKVVNLAELPSKDRLQALIGSKGIKIYYKDCAPQKKDRVSGLPLFSVACYLDDGDDGTVGKQIGWGSALSKKAAGGKAAEMAMSNGKIMRFYQERKRRVDEELRKQREMETSRDGQAGATDCGSIGKDTPYNVV